MLDCIEHLRRLHYQYDDNIAHGEIQLTNDAKKVFRETQVWVSINGDESQAIWCIQAKEGRIWIRQIITELNVVIKAGKGNQRRVVLIADELGNTEKMFPSTSITAYFKRFKDIASTHSVNKFEVGNQLKRVKDLGGGRDQWRW
jgi:hypothetical protein